MTCSITEDSFGTIFDQDTKSSYPVRRFTLRNRNGMQVQILNYGGTVTTLSVPTKNGEFKDIILGFDDIEGYLGLHGRNPYLGALQGRSTSRMKNATFTIEGKEYKLAKNAPGGSDHFHGGFKGFDKRIWNAYIEEKTNTLILSYLSKDGEEGYPGDLIVTATFKIDPIENHLHMKSTAMSTAPTTVDLANSLLTLNLSGHEAGNLALKDHFIEINAHNYTPVDSKMKVTGEINSVKNSIFDLRQPVDLYHLLQNFPVRDIGKNGFCHNFCIEQKREEPNSLAYVGKICSTSTGISMEIYSNQNGVSVFTCNFYADPKNPEEKPIKGKNGAEYYKHGGILVVPSNWPNAINEAKFPNAVLNPGEIYHNDTLLKFTVV